MIKPGADAPLKPWEPLGLSKSPTTDEVRKAAVEFRRRLNCPRMEPFNAIKRFREDFLQLDMFQFAGVLDYSTSWLYNVEAGATGIIPEAIRNLADRALGSGAGDLMQGMFSRWKESLSGETRARLDERFPRYPGQGVHGLG